MLDGERYGTRLADGTSVLRRGVSIIDEPRSSDMALNDELTIRAIVRDELEKAAAELSRGAAAATAEALRRGVL